MAPNLYEDNAQSPLRPSSRCGARNIHSQDCSLGRTDAWCGTIKHARPRPLNEGSCAFNQAHQIPLYNDDSNACLYEMREILRGWKAWAL